MAPPAEPSSIRWSVRDKVGAGAACGLAGGLFKEEEEDCCPCIAAEKEKSDTTARTSIRRPVEMLGKRVCKLIVFDVLVAFAPQLSRVVTRFEIEGFFLSWLMLILN